MDKWLSQVKEVLDSPSDNAIEFIDNFDFLSPKKFYALLLMVI
jgi:hypothetical protein